MLRVLSMELVGRLFMVGTIIADRPPHRTARARPRMRLPPRMTGVKALYRVRMENARRPGGEWQGPAAQFAGVSPASTEDLDRGAMTYPSPAEPYLKPAAAGVQALSMNSLRSAWTPVLAGLKRFHYAGEGKIRSLCPRSVLSVGLVQNIGQVSGEHPPLKANPRSMAVG
jgi:hypothetical protein